MGRPSNRSKLEKILTDNGYELIKDYYVGGKTNDPDFLMPSWIHTETKHYLAADFNMETELKFLLKYKIDKHITHGTAFSSETQEWYGWSHRVMFKFGIGTTCKKGDVHYTVGSKEEFIKDLVKNELNKNTHDVSLEWVGGDLVVTNTYKGDKEDPSQDRFIGDTSTETYQFPNDEGYNVVYDMVKCGDKECPWGGKDHPNPNEALPLECAEHKCEHVPSEPDVHFVPYGRGEWTAKTLDDAKQMAKDFCQGVS